MISEISEEKSRFFQVRMDEGKRAKGEMSPRNPQSLSHVPATAKGRDSTHTYNELTLAQLMAYLDKTVSFFGGRHSGPSLDRTSEPN